MKSSVTVATLTILLAALPSVGLAQRTAVAPDARSILNNAARAMGAEDLKTIQYSGSGSSFTFGQSVNPNAPWPRFSLSTYTREIDFDAPASRVQSVRTAVDRRGGGGIGIPVVNQSRDQFIRPDAPWAQQVDIWITPHGFVKAAMANNPTAESQTIGGTVFRVVSFTVQDKYRVNGYINEQNRVEKVETWVEYAALGDLLIDVTYADYRDFSGLWFPTRIVQNRGGFPVLDLTVTGAEANVAVNIEPPERAAAPAAPTAFRSIPVADGVFLIQGGSNNSVVVDFEDYIVMMGASRNDERALQFIAEAKRQIPNKPIRYVINSHHHFDHSGGLRAFAAEGATIVTHSLNAPYYARIFAAPSTIAPDRLSRSGTRAVFETLTEKKVLTDGTRTIELYLIQDSPHADGAIMAYLPAEKMLVQADIFDSPGPGVPALTEGVATVANLVDNIERLNLDVEQLLPIHAPGVVPVAELYEAAGRRAD